MTDKHLIELRKFLLAAQNHIKVTGRQAMMPQCDIDRAWHALLSDQEAYQTFVSACLGNSAVVTHLPATGEGHLAWVADYERMFGSLNEAWFSLDGVVDLVALERYRGTGDFYASWECTPGIAERIAA